jgi:hypothetical protein
MSEPQSPKEKAQGCMGCLILLLIIALPVYYYWSKADGIDELKGATVQDIFDNYPLDTHLAVWEEQGINIDELSLEEALKINPAVASVKWVSKKYLDGAIEEGPKIVTAIVRINHSHPEDAKMVVMNFLMAKPFFFYPSPKIAKIISYDLLMQNDQVNNMDDINEFLPRLLAWFKTS